MTADALETLRRENDNQNNTQVDQTVPTTYKPSYQAPTAEDIKEDGGLQPITADEQASQTTGGSHWDQQMEGLKQWRQMPASPEKDQFREDWHQKWTGKSYEEFKQKNFLERGMILNN